MGQKIKHTIWRGLNPFLRNRYKSFMAIGIANLIDKLYILDNIGNVPMVRLSYGAKETDTLLNGIKSLSKTDEKRGPVNILVGHAGTPGDNHLELLRRLEQYSQEKMCLNLVLSYGEQIYIQKVARMAKQLFGTKCRIIYKSMPYIDYVNFLSDMDIVILDDTHSSALGNLSWLVALEKTIYINKNSLYKRAMELEGLPFKLTESIGKIPFNSFIEKSIYKKPGIESALAPVSYSTCVNEWRGYLLALMKSDNKLKEIRNE